MDAIAKVVASAFVWHGEALLLLRRARDFREVPQGQGFWEPPGGKLEPGETLEQALARELREETGLVLAGARLVDACSYLLEGAERRSQRVHLCYRVTLAGWREPVLSDEHDDRRCVGSLPELRELPMLAEIRAVLERELAS